MRNRRCKKILENKLRCGEMASYGENYCKKHLKSHNWVHTFAVGVSRFIGATPKINYKDYIASDVWKGRSDLEKQKNPKCSLCNRKGELHVHHRTYVRLGKERDGDLTVLCDECHKLFHEHYRYVGDVGYFVRKGA